MFSASAAASAGDSGEVPAHVRAYDDAIEEPLANWSKLTDQLGGDLAAVVSVQMMFCID